MRRLRLDRRIKRIAKHVGLSEARVYGRLREAGVSIREPLRGKGERCGNEQDDEHWLSVRDLLERLGSVTSVQSYFSDQPANKLLDDECRVTCAGCGGKGPRPTLHVGGKEVPVRDTARAFEMAEEQGWKEQGKGRLYCPMCVAIGAAFVFSRNEGG